VYGVYWVFSISKAGKHGGREAWSLGSREARELRLWEAGKLRLDGLPQSFLASIYPRKSFLLILQE